MKKAKKLAESIPLVGPLIRSVARILFPGVQEYWESRYAAGGTSGTGSYGKLAEFKAKVLNDFVEKHNIQSIVEFGCGDGNQLSLAKYPAYIGLDVSKTAIKLCEERFNDDKTKRFFLYEPDCFVKGCSMFRAELALSLDVIYHLVEDKIFELYIRHLFSTAEKYVIIYSTDTDINRSFQAPHVKHRNFSKWVKENLSGWNLLRRISNECPFEIDTQAELYADFFVYEKL